MFRDNKGVVEIKTEEAERGVETRAGRGERKRAPYLKPSTWKILTFGRK